MGYTKETIKGLSWLGAFRLFTRSLSFLRTIIIARILSPYQFGVYGIAIFILALIEVLTETGINVFLVQKKDIIDKYVDTAWVVSILRGGLISAAIFVSSFLVAGFFKNQQVLPLLFLVSLVPLIRGFINPSIAAFQKDLKFHKEFYYRSSIFFVESLVAVALIILIRDPIALIYGLIAGALFEVAISFLFVKPVPSIKFDKSIFYEIVTHGKWVTGAGIFGYLFQNADNMVVGKILGVASLGIYDMAYTIAILPLTEFSEIVARVTFPVYVKISDDKQRLKRAYIKTSIITALLISPLLLIFLLFPTQLISIVLGPKWVSVGSILRILAIFAFINMLGSPTGAIFYSVGKQKYLTIISAISFFVMIAIIIPLIKILGLAGGAYAVLISSLIMFPFQLYFLFKSLSKNS